MSDAAHTHKDTHTLNPVSLDWRCPFFDPGGGFQIFGHSASHLSGCLVEPRIRRDPEDGDELKRADDVDGVAAPP